MIKEHEITARQIATVLLRSLKHAVGGLERLLRTGEV